MAEQVQGRLLSLTHVKDAVQRDDAERETVVLRFDEINAWLDQGLPQWAAHRNIELSEDIQNPMFAMRSGRLVFAWEYVSGDVSQIISLWFKLELKDEQARIHLEQIRGGSLPIPKDALLGQFGIDAEDPELHPIFRSALTGEPFEPVWKLDAVREARVVGLKMDREAVELTIEKQDRK